MVNQFFGIIALGIETGKTSKKSNHIRQELDILGVEIFRHFDYDYDDTYTYCVVVSGEEMDENHTTKKDTNSVQ